MQPADNGIVILEVVIIYSGGVHRNPKDRYVAQWHKAVDRALDYRPVGGLIQNLELNGNDNYALSSA
jgi:hypothetical protein